MVYEINQLALVHAVKGTPPGLIARNSAPDKSFHHLTVSVLIKRESLRRKMLRVGDEVLSEGLSILDELIALVP